MRSIVRRLLAFLPRPRPRVETHGRTRIAFDPAPPLHVREYHRHCLGLFAGAFARTDAAVNVIFGPLDVDFGDARRVLRIDVQSEHTLVKPGGRDSDGAPPGATRVARSDDRYLVRLTNLDYLRTLDAIVEYSGPNVAHVRDSGRFPEIAARTVLVAPLLHEPCFAAGRRDLEAITLIHDEGQSRRKAFLERAARAGLPLRNVRGVFDARELTRLHDRVRVLVNLRQTDHHDTLEELRVLPALLRGVIVVSEDVPLRESVPYHRFVEWSDYDGLVETVRRVTRDYHARRAAIFDGPELPAIVAEMERANASAVEAAVRRMIEGT